MRNLQGSVVVLLLVFFGLAATATAFYFYQKSQSPNLSTPTSTTSTPGVNPNQPLKTATAATTDETVGWKTYLNSKSKISFQYPSGWKINEYDNRDRVVAGDGSKYDFSVSLNIGSPTGSAPIIKNYLDYYISSSSQFLTGGKITKIEKIGVGKYGGTKYLIQESDPKSAGGTYIRAWVFIPNNNRVTYIREEPYEESSIQVMDKILATFKFLD